MYQEAAKSAGLTGMNKASAGGLNDVRSHVEELQRATSAVRSLVDSIERLRDTISGADRPPECGDTKLAATPCLLDQLMATPEEISASVDRGHKAIETMRGYLRLR